ncbi:hypothetical protein [Bacillus sp. BPN334]|nr:hypothetical protein [Bacillus sp. BPN334]
MKQPFLIGISFSDYKPGMKLCLHEDYESIQKDTILYYDLNQDLHVLYY